MAFGAIVTATIGCGRITGIDTDLARQMPGVLLVMTHENAPHQAPFQPKGEDRHARPKPQLASDKVQYFGQPVALVVAETAEGARAAADKVIVAYERTAGAFALDPASRDAYDPKKTDTGKPSDSKVGDFDSAFEVAAGAGRCDLQDALPEPRHDGAARQPRLVAGRQAHDPLRSLQLVESAHKSIASTLKLSPDKVEVISEYRRRRLRRQAAGLCRRHPGGAGVARAQAAGAGSC